MIFSKCVHPSIYWTIHTMRLYNMWAIIKIVVGFIILSILYNYVNVYQDPAIGISFWFLGIFMIVRWIGYFMFLWSYRIFSSHNYFKQASLSYKLSLLLGMYMMVNLTFIITDNWTKLMWLIILVCFVVLQVMFWSEKISPQY